MESQNDPSSSSTVTGGDGKLHIVMFPWLAFGHMVPFLELAKLIAQEGHTVSFVSTPRNIDRLPHLPPDLAPLVKFVKLSLPRVHRLPENAEATIDLTYNQAKYLKKAYDELQQPMAQFLQDADPDWVIYDFAPHWLGPIAAKLRIPIAFFSIFIAATLCFIGPTKVLMGLSEDYRTKPEEFTVPPKWVPSDSTIVFRLFEVKRIFDDLADVDEDNVPALYRMGACIEACDVLLVRSSYELEPEWLKLLQEIHQKPVIPVGLLATTAFDGGDDDDKDHSWSGIKEWLDKQSKGSVVYVAFGTESQPSQAEITEIALGLEISELSFFWVLRKPCGSAPIELPDEFEKRTKGRGVVCTSWVPQLKILGHDSVGGFLSHSGLSSVVEAIQFEKPLILLTFLADTGLIARFWEEKEMAYSIPRNELDGRFTRDSVAESLRLVMVGEEGKIYRDKVKEMKALIGDRDIQAKYVNKLLDYLKTHQRQASSEAK